MDRALLPMQKLPYIVRLSVFQACKKLAYFKPFDFLSKIILYFSCGPSLYFPSKKTILLRQFVTDVSFKNIACVYWYLTPRQLKAKMLLMHENFLMVLVKADVKRINLRSKSFSWKTWLINKYCAVKILKYLKQINQSQYFQMYRYKPVIKNISQSGGSLVKLWTMIDRFLQMSKCLQIRELIRRLACQKCSTVRFKERSLQNVWNCSLKGSIIKKRNHHFKMFAIKVSLN